MPEDPKAFTKYFIDQIPDHLLLDPIYSLHEMKIGDSSNLFEAKNIPRFLGTILKIQKKYSDNIILTLECPFSNIENPDLLGETVTYTVRGESSV